MDLSRCSCVNFVSIRNHVLTIGTKRRFLFTRSSGTDLRITRVSVFYLFATCRVELRRPGTAPYAHYQWKVSSDSLQVRVVHTWQEITSREGIEYRANNEDEKKKKTTGRGYRSAASTNSCAQQNGQSHRRRRRRPRRSIPGLCDTYRLESRV